MPQQHSAHSMRSLHSLARQDPSIRAIPYSRSPRAGDSQAHTHQQQALQTKQHELCLKLAQQGLGASIPPEHSSPYPQRINILKIAERSGKHAFSPWKTGSSFLLLI